MPQNPKYNRNYKTEGESCGNDSPFKSYNSSVLLVLNELLEPAGR